MPAADGAAAPRIALIHALSHSILPINQAMAAAWPQAVRMNLLDDSLSADLARSGGRLDGAMHQRFEDLTAYAEHTGAAAVLFTCSAFGPCIEAVAARRSGLPVLKPNEAMVAEAAAGPGPVGLLATFGPTLMSMPAEFPVDLDLRTALAEGALAALDAGDTATHDRLALEAAHRLAGQGCRVIALAQFSLARAKPLIEDAVGLPVLSTPDSAVRRLRQLLRS